MRVIVTGAGGFLGKSIVKKLVDDNQIEVLAITSQAKSLQKEFEKAKNLKVGTQEDVVLGKYKFDREDVLINCAFPRDAIGAEFAQGLEYISKTLRATVERGISAVINISSQSVYSSQRNSAASESDTPIVLETVYAVGKYATELLTEAICYQNVYTNIRMASLIGPTFNQRVTNKLVECALEKGEISVNTGEEKFGFLDIDDAVVGILKLAQLPRAKWKKAYNLGGRQAYSLLEIANTIAKVFRGEMDKTIKVKISSGTATVNTALDNTLLSTDTGYQQTVTLEESIRRILKEKIK